jgi:O-antigen/teichoic acid export membrane protein
MAIEDPSQSPAGPGLHDELLDTPAAGPAAIRGGALRVTSYGAGVLLSVGAAALLFRHLGVVDGGRYVTVLSLMGLFAGIADAGLITVGVRELTIRRGADRSHFLQNLLGLRIALTVLAVAGATAFAAIAGYPSVMVAGTVVAGVGFLLAGIQGALGTSLMARLRLGWVSMLEFLRNAVTVVLIVALVVAGAGLLPFFATSIVAGIAILIPTALLVRGDIPLMPQFHTGAWKRIMRDLLPYAAATAVVAVYFRIAIIIVSLISSPEQTGYFGASFRIVEVVIGLPQLAIGAAFPIFAHAAQSDRARLAYGVQRVFEASLLLGGLVLVGFGLGAPLAIRIVAGPDFAPAADVLRIQSVGLFCSFVAATWGFTLLSLHRHRQILWLSVLPLVVNVVLTLILASIADARGAAVATTIGEAVYMIAAGIATARALDGALNWRAVPRVAAALVLPALLLLVPGLPSLVAVLIGVPLFLLVAYALGAVPDELLDEVRAVARRRRAQRGW